MASQLQTSLTSRTVREYISVDGGGAALSRWSWEEKFECLTSVTRERKTAQVLGIKKSGFGWVLVSGH